MKIWCWNIAGVAVNECRTDSGMTEQVASGAKTLDVDFICLQEVAYQQFQDIQSRLGVWAKTAVFTAQHDTAANGQPYGVALFSKWATTDTQVTILGTADSYGEVRRAISVLWGTRRVGSLHATATASENATQLETLRTAAEGWVNNGQQVYIAGDWNTQWTNANMAPWRNSSKGWQQSDPAVLSKIDMCVYANTQMTYRAEWLLDYAPGKDTKTNLSSDHKAVIIDLRETAGSTGMSMDTGIQALVARLRTKINSLSTLIKGNNADLSVLVTDTKTSILAALNEVAGGNGWTTVTPDTGFSAQNSGFPMIRWRKEGVCVTVEVAVKKTDASTFAASDVSLNTTNPLPAAIRPSNGVNGQVNTNNSVARVVVNSSGVLIYRGGGQSSVSYVIGQFQYRL